MSYTFKIDTDFRGGYLIKRRDTSSLDNPWTTVAKVDIEKDFSFSSSINNSHDKEEILRFVSLADLI